MRKRFQPALALALAAANLLALAAAPAFAGTYYVPNPDTGGFGKPKSKVEVTPGGSRQIAPIFIAAGTNGTGLTSGTVQVDNDVKPNVFDIWDYITGPGMLKLVSADMGVKSGSLFLSPGTQTIDWALPILGEGNWFQPQTTAYIQGLARTATGASNLEIMNFSGNTASCQIQYLRPKGSLLGGPKPASLAALSQIVLQDVLNGVLGGPTGAGVKAQVTCDQPFYAYGTFVDPDVFKFRLLYPLSAPSQAITETVAIDRPGTFFSPVEGNSSLQINLPLVPNRSYRAASIDFDVRISQFSPIFTGLLGMWHVGGPRFNKTLYFGTFVRGARSRSLVDQGSPVVEPALQLSTGWKEGGTFHVTIVYDTQTATMRWVVTTATGAVLNDVTAAAYNYDLADRGNPVVLQFGLPGVGDGAYYPPNGWKFSNLHVRVTR
jgi:hypothetical protein